MKIDRYEPKQNTENTKDSCNYCHSTTLQQVGNEKVCPHCGTRVYSTSVMTGMPFNMTSARISVGTR
jgi:uncharacterized paraquat-inducible protein A